VRLDEALSGLAEISPRQAAIVESRFFAGLEVAGVAALLSVSEATALREWRANLGRYAEAERYDREALAIVRAWYGPEHPATASSMTMLGRALVFQQRHDEA
jgi:hypothetical protein